LLPGQGAVLAFRENSTPRVRSSDRDQPAVTISGKVRSGAMPVGADALRVVLDVVLAQPGAGVRTLEAVCRAQAALAVGLPFAVVGHADLARLCARIPQVAALPADEVDRVADAVSRRRGEQVGAHGLLGELLGACVEIRASAQAWSAVHGVRPPGTD
jgi:hypothetical protein